jgi:hypothetical protein
LPFFPASLSSTLSAFPQYGHLKRITCDLLDCPSPILPTCCKVLRRTINPTAEGRVGSPDVRFGKEKHYPGTGSFHDDPQEQGAAPQRLDTTLPQRCALCQSPTLFVEDNRKHVLSQNGRGFARALPSLSHLPHPPTPYDSTVGGKHHIG